MHVEDIYCFFGVIFYYFERIFHFSGIKPPYPIICQHAGNSISSLLARIKPLSYLLKKPFVRISTGQKKSYTPTISKNYCPNLE